MEDHEIDSMYELVGEQQANSTLSMNNCEAYLMTNIWSLTDDNK